MRKTLWLGVLFVAVIVAALVYTSVGAARHRCEVCMTYMGRTSCKTASAGSRQEALRTATQNACADIASGMTESNQCENGAPQSVRWLSQ